MKILIVGAGGIGSHTAVELAAAGHEVDLASRSGKGLATGVLGRGLTAGIPGTDRAAAAQTAARTLDAADSDALIAAARGADIIVNALNPAYTRWASEWPPIAAGLLRAAELSGAGLITVGNLYPYGTVNAPMNEQTPIAPNGPKGRVRADMWAEALAAHRADRVRAVEVRASDYFGPGATRGTSFLNEYVIGPAAKGRVCRPPMGSADAPHSWNYLPDIARLVAALTATDRNGADWGRVWHVPSPAPRTMAEVARDTAALLGIPSRGVKPWPNWVRAALKPVVPIIRELDETAHQFERPFEIDGSAAERRFGVVPTEWETALRSTIFTAQHHRAA